MSESDDTDYLILIPPNFFLVPSDNESDFSPKEKSFNNDVVTELIDQVHDLKNRVSVIESLESSQVTVIGDLDRASFASTPKVSKQISSLTSTSREALVDNAVLNWIHSSPFRASTLGDVSSFRIDATFSSIGRNSVDNLDKIVHSNNAGGCSNISRMSSPKQNPKMNSNLNESPRQKKLELTEVDRLLKEMEMTQRDIENKLRMREQEYGLSVDVHNTPEKPKKISLLGDNIGSVPDLGFGIRNMFSDSPNVSPEKKLEDPKPVIEEPCTKRTVSLLGESPGAVDKGQWKSFMTHSPNTPVDKSVTSNPKPTESRNSSFSARRRLSLNDEEGVTKTTDTQRFLSKNDFPVKNSLMNSQSDSVKSRFVTKESTYDDPYSLNHIGQNFRQKEETLGGYGNKLLSLTDLWKGEDEFSSRNPVRLKQKLEEERYRRVHLETTVQALQKKVLEEQEKVAVAIQVDEKKDVVIEKVTEAWKQMVDHWRQIEEQRHAAAQALLAEKAVTKKAQEEVNKKVARWEREVSQALDLAAGFKTKAESLEREFMKARSEYEIKLEEAESKVREARLAFDVKESEVKDLQERLDQAFHDVHEERKISEDSRMEIICLEEKLGKMEGELTVVKEQRDLLAMRMKEERARVGNLEQAKASLTQALNEAQEKQKEAENGFMGSKKQLENIKSELRTVYQSQLESVVREKLAEFQCQLESARDEMRLQLDSELAAARDSAAKHQQSLVNSHVIEMRRLESIHKDELRSLERRLSEAESKCSRLERGKKDVAQKLHAVMESQWQQALSIITNELSMRQVEPDHERLKTAVKEPVAAHEYAVDANTTADSVPEPPSHLPNQGQLFNYIQMLLEKQPGRPVESATSSGLAADTTNEPLDDSALDSLKWNHLIAPGGDQRGIGRKPPWK